MLADDMLGSSNPGLKMHYIYAIANTSLVSTVLPPKHVEKYKPNYWQKAGQFTQSQL